MLPQCHQQAVQGYPVLLWEYGAEHLLCLIRVFCLYIAPAVADAMHMRINADTW